MRASLLISAALNLLLITGIVAARVDQSRSEADDLIELRAFDAPVPLVWNDDPGSLAELEMRLQSAGFDESLIKPLVLGWLSEREAGLEPGREDAYWLAPYRPAQADLARRIAIEERIREALLDHYGQAAAQDPAFAAVFRPLGPSFAFLSSGQQLALQQGQLESLGTPVAPSAAHCTRSELGAPLASSSPGPLAALDDTAHAEYLVRFSPRAEHIRQSQVADGEAEFREIFDLLQALDAAHSTSDHLRLRRALRRMLGDADFDRLWGRRDPFRAEIERHLQSEGFGLAVIESAYGVINQTQEALLETMAREPGQAALIEAASAASEQEAIRLAGLLGEPAADRLLAKKLELAMRLSTDGPRTC